MRSKDRVSILPLVVAVGVLVLLISFFRCPYWYYTLMRIVTMLVATYLVYKYCVQKRLLFALVCLLIIVVFQPFYKLPIGRTLWGIIDFAVLVFWFASFAVLGNFDLGTEQDRSKHNDNADDQDIDIDKKREPNRVCFNNEWWSIRRRSHLKDVELGLIKLAKYVKKDDVGFCISFLLQSGQVVSISSLYAPNYKDGDSVDLSNIEILTVFNHNKGEKEVAWIGGSLTAIEHIVPIVIREEAPTYPVTRETEDLHKSEEPYYIFFDTESTGLPVNYKAPAADVNNWPRLVQIAWILTDYDGKVIKKSSRLICPTNYSISEEATRIHGITNEYARNNGVALSSVMEEFGQDLAKAKVKVAHNIEFDNNVIHAEFIRLGKEIIWNNGPNKSVCTMKSSTNYCKIPHDYYGYKYPSLHELYMKLFKERLDGAHDALTDIEATCKCFFRLRSLQQL